MPSRRDFIKYLGASGVASAAAVKTAKASAAGAAASSGPRPNVVFVLADQWRPSALEMGPANDNSYQTTQLLKTPRLKEFGEKGIRLDRCYTTKPVCTPNRSAIITGQYPHETGMLDNNLMLPPNIPCLPDVLSDAGYRTYYLGKWHMDGTGKGTSGAPAAGFVPKNWRRRGLERWDGMNRGHSYYANSFMLDDDGVKIPVPAANPSGTLDEQLADFEPHIQTDLAMDYISDHQTNHTDENFFIWMNYGPPHDPFSPPAPFDTYDQNDLVARPNNASASNMPALSNYYGLCEALDYEFGRLLDHLDSLGLENETIVVFTSDHGEMMGSHDQIRKGQMYEESWRVPFLARWPGKIATDAVSDAPYSSTDIMPTLLGLCGLETPASVTGLDKSELLCGNAITETPVFGENEATSGGAKAWRGVVQRVGGVMYKLVQQPDTAGTALESTQLYDLDADPYEQNNLLASPSHAANLALLETTMANWRTETGDTFYPAQQTPRAAKSYPDTATVQLPLKSKMRKEPGGELFLDVESQSRVFFTLQKSPDLTSMSWSDVGSARHGNGNTLSFPLAELPVAGIPRQFYRVKAEEVLVTGTTDFVNGGDIAGVTTSDWSDGVPSASMPGTIGMTITSGTMGNGLAGQVITQLGGTISIANGTASSRAFSGSTRYTLVNGIFTRTTSHVLRLGQNTAASDVEFNLVGGTLDLSSAAGATGLVFMGTNSVLNVSGGTADISGNQIQLHATSNHTDTPFINFEEEGEGLVTCQDLTFQPGKLGYINFQAGSAGVLTVTGNITNEGTGSQTFENLWDVGRLRYLGENVGSFSDVFQVNGNSLSLK
ncbi:MAG: sulfatase-like hydrolase/transferase [Akkermansiaceae bacterium]